MQVLSEDILRRIFVHVGPEDTIWNCRRVCKSWDLASKDEDLAQSWIDQNSTWKYDWRNDNNRIQDNESSSSQPLWTYCFHRVTVSKFFQKLINSLSPFWHRVDQPKPVEELYASWNQFHAKDEFNHRLPWELFEFSRITNGIFLSKAQEECIHIKFPLEKPHFVFEKELKAKEADSWAPSMDFNGTGTWKWIRIGLNQAEVEDLVVCCDPENESFGAISMWSSARALGYPVSVSLIELLRGLHWQHTLILKELGEEQWKKCIKDLDEMNGMNNYTLGDWFDCLRTIASWAECDGKGKTELPETRPNHPSESEGFNDVVMEQEFRM